MITIQSSSELPIFVETSGGERCFESGTWTVPDASSVGCWTNAPVSVSVRSGAVVTVDQGGLVSVTEGPDLAGSAGMGFGLAVGVVGVWVGLRWAARKVLSVSTVVPSSVID